MADLEARAVTKRFGGVLALDGVDFEADAGEVHALIGENGAGKSTFIKILTGAVRPDEGEVVLFGEPLAARSPRDAASHGVAAVFQELSLVPDLTVAENVWFRRERLTPLGTISRRRVRRDTRALFGRLDFPPLDPDIEVRSLSVAERQLVEVAKAVAGDPRVLILDEATSALSPKEVSWLLDLARRLAAGGMIVVYISHRLAEVREVASRITVFRNGHSVGVTEGAAASEDEIVSMMLGRRLERLYPDKEATATEAVALRVRDLRFGHRLRGIDLDLREGEILGVGGLQGQGQLELFLSLFGVLRARGTIELDGRPVKISSPRAALAAGIGLALVPEDRQNQGLLLPKSVRENVTLAVTKRFSRRGLLDLERERALVGDAIRQLSIVLSSPEQPVGSLSGGNQQKVVISKLLLTRAKVLLLYDLTRGVDVGTKGEIFQLMRNLAREGYAILFFSTDLQELIHVADRVAVISDGSVTGLLEGEAITEDRILRASVAGGTAA
ncbi:MAG: sugar ABC transporter ATP-binding protein [Actinobacteria bacterium]|nr:sugar ABC transporter ATP-binding protein [Actinomycetota bacterium]